MKLWFRLLLVPLLAGASLAQAKGKATKHATPSPGSYTGAIVLDAATGQTLWEDNADVTNPPASMTKLMTFAVLHDKLAAGSLTLQTPVTVNRDEAKFAMKADSTSVWLKQGETFSVEELIYAMMIQSANDASLALARVAAGSPEAFVELMNAKAQQLGMNHSTFRTPHGFSRGKLETMIVDMTTPRDFAKLCRHLVLNTDVLKYSSVQQRGFGAGQRAQLVDMRNHNHLLGKLGVDGLKTGYTEAAGYCLSATAVRNGRRVVAVIMGSFGPNGAKDKGRARDLKMIEMLERGFAAVPAKLPSVAGAAETAAPSPAVAPTVSGHKSILSVDAIPTVKTDAAPKPAAASDESSTAKEPAVVFRVNLPATPSKKP